MSHPAPRPPRPTYPCSWRLADGCTGRSAVYGGACPACRELCRKFARIAHGGRP